MVRRNNSVNTNNSPPSPLDGAQSAASPLVASSPEDPHESHIDDLIRQIKESADKLAEDRSSRGDLKLLSRALRELRYALKVFSPFRRQRKVTVFGSARTLPDDPAYQQAMDFGRAMAQHNWLVVTGAASGIMEAGHRGAGREHSMGLNIMLPMEQAANEFIAGDAKLVHMKYFFTRKLMFVKECDAVVCLPGGFGTLDEGMEVITLLQTGKRDMIPVVLLNAPGDTYWEHLQDFVQNQLLKRGMISPDDLALYRITDSCADAVDEVLGFFRVYQGMRFVKRQLVFRLRAPLSDSTVAQFNVEFGDLLSEGRFVQCGPLPDERDEPELAAFPRLAFAFNRRNFGRLRMLIDRINATADSP